MRLSRSFAIVLRQYYLMRGSFTRIMPLFIWVAIDMVLWGFLSRYLGTLISPGFSLAATLLGAVLLWDFFTRIMHGVGMAFLEDVWSRNFLNIFATPLSTGEYLLGLVITGCLTSLVGLATMLLIVVVGFDFSLLAMGAMAAPFAFVLILFGIALGIFGCAMLLRLGPAAEWFMWPIPAALSPFVGVFYPIASLPEWMQYVAKLLPPAYVFENLRAILAGNAPDLQGLAVAGALSIAYVLIACAFFARVFRYTLKTGLIARYSAENVA